MRRYPRPVSTRLHRPDRWKFIQLCGDGYVLAIRPGAFERGEEFVSLLRHARVCSTVVIDRPRRNFRDHDFTALKPVREDVLVQEHGEVY